MEQKRDVVLNLSTLTPKKKLRPRLRRAFRRTSLAIAVALIATCVLCGMLARNIWIEVRYARNGVATTGVFITVNTNYREDKSLSYSFRPEGGERRIGIAPHGAFATWHKGDEIPVEYIQDDPATNRPVPMGWFARLSFLIPGLGAALVAVIGIYLRRYRRRSVTVLMRILTQGVLTRGAVLAKERYRRRHRSYYRVTYAFALPSGSEHESEDSLLDRKSTEHLESGSPVAVAVLEDEPESCYLFRPQWLAWFADDDARRAVEQFVREPGGDASGTE